MYAGSVETDDGSWTFKLTMATSTASGLEWERSQSRRSEWSLARPRVSLRYLSSKQMFSTVVPCTGRESWLKEAREQCRSQLCTLRHQKAEQWHQSSIDSSWWLIRFRDDWILYPMCCTSLSLHCKTVNDNVVCWVLFNTGMTEFTVCWTPKCTGLVQLEKPWIFG